MSSTLSRIFLILGIIYSLPSYSQLTNSIGLDINRASSSGSGYINVNTNGWPDASSIVSLNSSGGAWSILKLGGANVGHWAFLGPESWTSNYPLRISWNSTTTAFTLLNNGRVGIGNVTPKAQLQLENLSASRKIILQESADNDHQFFGFGVNIGANNGYLRYQIPSSIAGAAHVFYSGNGASASNELLRIQGDGRVGIGASTPAARLHVNGGAVLFDGTTGATPASGAGARMMWIPSKYAFRAGQVSGSKWDATNIGENSVAFGYDNLSSGNGSFVGGMSSSVSGNNSAALGYNNTVSGGLSFAFGTNNTISATYGFAGGTGNTITQNYSTSLGDENTNNGIYSFTIGRLNSVQAENAFALGCRNTASGYRSGTIGTYTKASAQYAFTIGTGIDATNVLENANTQSLMIGYNSNLPTLFVKGSDGVGTTGAVAIATTTIPSTAPTSSGYKFVVAGHSYLNGSVVIGDQSTITAGTTFPSGYKLYVTDGILTEKVKVALKSSTAWADFVFDKDYELMPLDSVETYIKENKHLPSIPSADETVKNGVDLLEMDAKLLQKVEELTLYIIEQRKEIQELKKKVEKLENK